MNLQRPVITCALAAASLVFSCVPHAAEALQYDRTAIAGGQWWRWLTGHLTHFGANHLVWDVVVLVALGTWCEWQSRIRTAAALALASIAIPVALWWLQPQFVVYRGLSGVDSALFGLAAGSLLHRRVPITTLAGVVALLAFAGKCAIEITTAATVFTDSVEYAPVPLAHAIGLAAGMLASRVDRVPVSRPSLAATAKNAIQ